MDVMEAIVTRRSIRKFLNTPVEFDKIGEILKAARWAPSAGNIHDVKVVVVTEKETRKAIARACLDQIWMEQAPVHLVVLVELFKIEPFYGIRGERLYALQDAAAAVQNMLLVAHAQGLGACWVGAFDEEQIKTLVNITGQARPQVIIPIGYPDEHPEAPPKQSVEDLMYFRTYGTQAGKIRDIDQTLGYTSKDVQRILNKAREIADKAGDVLREKLGGVSKKRDE